MTLLELLSEGIALYGECWLSSSLFRLARYFSSFRGSINCKPHWVNGASTKDCSWKSFTAEKSMMHGWWSSRISDLVRQKARFPLLSIAGMMELDTRMQFNLFLPRILVGGGWEWVCTIVAGSTSPHVMQRDERKPSWVGWITWCPGIGAFLIWELFICIQCEYYIKPICGEVLNPSLKIQDELMPGMRLLISFELAALSR